MNNSNKFPEKGAVKQEIPDIHLRVIYRTFLKTDVITATPVVCHIVVCVLHRVDTIASCTISVIFPGFVYSERIITRNLKGGKL